MDEPPFQFITFLIVPIPHNLKFFILNLLPSRIAPLGVGDY